MTPVNHVSTRGRVSPKTIGNVGTLSLSVRLARSVLGRKSVRNVAFKGHLPGAPTCHGLALGVVEIKAALSMIEQEVREASPVAT